MSVSLWIRENGDPGCYRKWCEDARGPVSAAIRACRHLLRGRDVEIVQWRRRVASKASPAAPGGV